MNGATLRRLHRGLLERRWVTGALAILLIGISLLLAWQSERAAIADQTRQIRVQSQMLASGVASSLAFDDARTTREYLDAFKLNRNIQAAGVYDEGGHLIAGFGVAGAPPGQVRSEQLTIAGRQLVAVEPVRQANLFLGYVYLRSSIESLRARASRYLAIGIVVVLAALLIGLLGTANAAAAAANRALQEQIAAREEAESALRQAQKMEALGQLTGGVAHDFNNLLMAASSGLDLLERAKTDERRDWLKAGIRDALDRGARLTQQLLAFARRTPVQTDVIDVREQVDKLADLLNRSLREDVEVAFEIPPDLWPIEVDVAQLDVAILNLAVNARDAMPRGGRICITAHNRPGGLGERDAVEIALADEGAGMPPETLDKAFEPFFTTKERGRGTGLGLSQVYGFARASGGTVAISSTPGQGTTVTLLVPRSHLPLPAGRVLPARAEAARLVGLRAMLVEDDPALNQLIGQMLAEAGLVVARATSAAEGLAHFEAEPADIVLSDMVMPGAMDGLELARRLRKKRGELPIVLMTGYSEAAGAAADEGFTVVRKPFTLDELVRSLTAAL